MEHQGKKWVIVFLIYADFRTPEGTRIDFGTPPLAMNESTKIELNLMLKEIYTTPINSETARVFVILNSIKYEEVKDNGDITTNDNMLFFELERNGEDGVFNGFKYSVVLSDEHALLRDSSVPVFQVTEKLLQILKKNIRVKENEDVFFITWDHGSAFGIFRDEKPSLSRSFLDASRESRILKNKTIYDELEKYPYLELFWKKALSANPDFKNRMIEYQKNKFYMPILEYKQNFFTVLGKKKQKEYLKKALRTTILSKFGKVEEGEHGCVLKFNKKQVEQEELAKLVNDPKTENLPVKKSDEDLKMVKVAEILKNHELAKVFNEWLGKKKVSVF